MRNSEGIHPWKHFKTITKHRNLVMAMCFRIGLYRQGLLHDLSKYSWTEFSRGCRYFQGNRSPNNYEREKNGFSLSWLHHKGRNKHHFEYWLDYDERRNGGVKGMPMPRRYIAEMYCDRVAACITYQKEDYDDLSPIRYFYRGSGKYLMHPDTRRDIGFLLTMLGERGSRATERYIKTVYLRGGEIPEDYREFSSLEEFDAAHGPDGANGAHAAHGANGEIGAHAAHGANGADGAHAARGKNGV